MSSGAVLAVLLVCACAGVRGASLISTDTLTADPQVFPDPPWLAIFRCFQSDSPSACFQSRAVRALEDMLPEDSEDVDKTSDVEEKLPKGVSPSVGRLIDRIGDLIASGLSQWYPDTEADTEETAKSADSVEEARGHKKKKIHKEVKKLVVKFLVLLYVKQQAIRLFLYGAQTFILFKFMVFAGVYVLTQIVKVWTLLKWHHLEKHNPKVLYIEPQIKHVTQHHAHVAPHEEVVHHDHYSPEGVEYEPGAEHDSLWPRSNEGAQRLAYYKQIPQQAVN